MNQNYPMPNAPENNNTTPNMGVTPTPIANPNPVPTQQPVATNTQPPVFINPEPEKKSKLPIILGVLLVIVLLLVAGYFLFLKGDNKEKESSNSNSNTNSNTNTNEGESTELDFSWAGQYTGQGYTLELYYSSLDSISFSLTVNDGEYVRNMGTDIDLPKGNSIDYQDDFDRKETLHIEKTTTGIKVVATSDDEDSLLHNLNLELTKTPFTTNGWNGVYKMGDDMIILNEMSDSYNFIVFVSSKDGIFVTSVSNQADTLSYQGRDGQNATITKTTKGLTVESNIVSSGEYSKQ